MEKCAESEDSRNQNCFEILHAGEGKGFGVFATRNFEKGQSLSTKFNIYDGMYINEKKQF